MGSQINKYRRLAGRFKTLSGCAAVLCALSSATLLVLGQRGPDELHIHRHSARGAVYYLSDAQEQIENIAVGGVIVALAAGVALALASQGFKRRMDQEYQKQLLFDESDPKVSD
jgi:hypothetical protein